MTWILANQQGTKAVEFTSIISIDVKDEGSAVSAPVEEGSFANYNKVQSPSQIKVSLGISGANDVLADALKSIETLQKETEIITLSTPTAFYESLTLESYDYKLSQQNGFLTVDLKLVEVREVATQTSTTEYTRPKVKNPTSASTQQGGKVQTKDVEAPKKDNPTVLGGLTSGPAPAPAALGRASLPQRGNQIATGWQPNTYEGGKTGSKALKDNTAKVQNPTGGAAT